MDRIEEEEGDAKPVSVAMCWSEHGMGTDRPHELVAYARFCRAFRGDHPVSG